MSDTTGGALTAAPRRVDRLPRRFVAVLHALLALGFAGGALHRVLSANGIVDSDFTVFRGAWWLILHGRGGALYDAAAQRTAQLTLTNGREFAGGLLAFLNPPHAALAGVPFGWIGEHFGATAAFALWTCANLALLFRLDALVRRILDAPRGEFRWLVTLAILAFYPVFYTVAIGQVSLLLAVASLELLCALEQRRARTAAAWLLVLTIKPQLVPPIIVLLACHAYSPVLILAGGLGAGLAILSAVALGPAIWLEYASQLHSLERFFGAGTPAYMVNLRGALTRVVPNGSTDAIYAISVAAWLAATAAFAMVLARRRRTGVASLRADFALALGATLFFNPHVFPQDAVIWIVPLTAFTQALRDAQRSWKPFAVFALSWPAAFTIGRLLDGQGMSAAAVLAWLLPMLCALALMARGCNATAPERSRAALTTPRLLRAAASTFALVAAVVCVYSVRQADPDLWGYLSYGRLFLERGAIVRDDPFAYTSSGHTWVTFEYGAHVLLWTAFHYGGALGLIALKCLLGGAALYCLFAAIRDASDQPPVWLPVFLLATSAVSRYFLFRPQLFTFACFALFVLLLRRFLLRGDTRGLWVLPFVMVLWVNTHGGFVAGLGALGLAMGLRVSANVRLRPFDPRRFLAGTLPLWFAVAASAAATLLNPLGLRLWRYVLTELTHNTNRQYIAEWRPVSLSNDPWSAMVLTLLTVMLITAAWLAHRRGRTAAGPPPIAWAASCVPLIAMSYLSVRHVPLAALWTAPVIALLGSRIRMDVPAAIHSRRLWFVLRGLGAVPVLLTFAVVYAEPGPSIRRTGTLGRTDPCGAVDFLRRNHLTGNLYTPLWWGAYITWELHPDVRVSMDGRNISLFAGDQVLENLRFYSQNVDEADENVPLRYATDFLLIPTDRPIIQRVRSDERWTQLYADRDAVLFGHVIAGAAPSFSLSTSTPYSVPETCSAGLDTAPFARRIAR